MKKRGIILTMLMLLLGSCGTTPSNGTSTSNNNNNSNDSSNIPVTEYVTIKYDANGGEFQDGQTILETEIIKGQKASAPTSLPTRKDYEFVGWTLENNNNTSLWNFNDIVNESMTLYAYWKEDEKIYETYFDFIEVENGYSIKAKKIPDDGIVNIPSTYKEKPVVEIAENAFTHCTSMTIVNIPESIASIGEYAFSGCSSLTSIEIPNSVSNIGLFILEDCYSLESLSLPFLNYILGTLFGTNIWEYHEQSNTIPSSLKEINITGGSSIPNNAFYNCSSLTSIVIPDSVTSIEEYAFYGCKSLTSITISNSVTSIGSRAFYNCSSLIIYCETSTQPSGWDSSWNYSGRPVYWGVTLDDIIYQDGLQYLITDGKAVVTRCDTNITNVVIPKTIEANGITYSVTSIRESAFYGCKSFTSITIPNSVTSIGSCAFYNCSSLTSIVIPNSVTSIDARAFYNCSSLTDTYYNGTLEDWCNISFENMDSSPMYYAKHFYLLNDHNEYEEVTEIIIPNTITSIKNYTFYGFSNVTNIMIPNNVTSIGDRAFSQCSSLQYNEYGNCYFLGNEENPYLVLVKASNTSITTATISNDTRFIMAEAFLGCKSLTSIEIPNSVTDIGVQVFDYCSQLTSVTFEEGSKLTSIGLSAFSSCSLLTSIVIPVGVTYMGNSVFKNCSSLTIYCEANSKPDGWASNWNYSNRPVYWAGTWSYVDGVPTPNN